MSTIELLRYEPELEMWYWEGFANDGRKAVGRLYEIDNRKLTEDEARLAVTKEFAAFLADAGVA